MFWTWRKLILRGRGVFRSTYSFIGASDRHRRSPLCEPLLHTLAGGVVYRSYAILWCHLSAMFRSLPSASAPLLAFVEVILCEYDEDYDAEEDADVSIREILTGGAASLKTIELNGVCLYDCVPPLSMVTTSPMYGTVKGPLPFLRHIQQSSGFDAPLPLFCRFACRTRTTSLFLSPAAPKATYSGAHMAIGRWSG
jgi:hypothetical protein